jgi:hypothetical protein
MPFACRARLAQVSIIGALFQAHAHHRFAQRNPLRKAHFARFRFKVAIIQAHVAVMIVPIAETMCGESPAIQIAPAHAQHKNLQIMAIALRTAKVVPITIVVEARTTMFAETIAGA